MSFLGKMFMPQSKAVASNVNQKPLTELYMPQARQGITGGNYLTALLTGQGPDVGAANAGYQAYLDNAGYEDALRRMSQSVVGGGAASGLLRSGSTAKALNAQGAEINRGYFNNYLSSLADLSGMGQQAGQLVGQAGQGQVVKKPSIWSAIASAGGTGLASLKSDRRLKENIVQVGTYPNGLPMYEFSYKDRLDGDARFRGIMSDDVRKKYPDAVQVMADGFDAVNYAMLGIEMESV